MFQLKATTAAWAQVRVNHSSKTNNLPERFAALSTGTDELEVSSS